MWKKFLFYLLFGEETLVLHYRWSAGNSIATLAEVKYKPTGEYNAEMQEEVRLHLRVCTCPGVVQILAVAL